MDGSQAFEGITLQYPLEISRRLFDAVVDANGNGNYTTITEAIENAPSSSEEPYLIFVADGNYNEMLSVSKPYIHLIGQSRENTCIQYAVNRTGNSDGTQGSATDEAWEYSIKTVPLLPVRTVIPPRMRLWCLSRQTHPEWISMVKTFLLSTFSELTVNVMTEVCCSTDRQMP